MRPQGVGVHTASERGQLEAMTPQALARVRPGPWAPPSTCILPRKRCGRALVALAPTGPRSSPSQGALTSLITGETRQNRQSGGFRNSAGLRGSVTACKAGSRPDSGLRFLIPCAGGRRKRICRAVGDQPAGRARRYGSPYSCTGTQAPLGSAFITQLLLSSGALLVDDDKTPNHIGAYLPTSHLPGGRSTC